MINPSTYILTPMKTIATASVIIGSLAAQSSFASDPDNWVLNHAKERLVPKIRDKMNEKWDDEIIPALLDRLGGEDFHKKFAGELFSSMLGGFPGLAFNAFLGPSGPSEMQVMTEVILTAISESEGRIIDAIEASDQEDTEDRLAALVDWWGKYNSNRLWSERADGLLQMSYEATTIRKRLEQSGAAAADTIQLYMLLVSLEMQIDRHLTSLLALEENPLASEEMIKQEHFPTFRETVDQVSNYLIHGEAGSIRAWGAASREHLENGGSVHDFTRIGHAPVAAILDSWWEAVGYPQRPLSDVEWSYAAPTYAIPSYTSFDNDNGHYTIKFRSFDGPWRGHMGTIKETSHFPDGSSEVREFQVSGQSFRQVKSKSGVYTYEVVEYCAFYYSPGPQGSRSYNRCTSGGDVTINVSVRE